MSKATTRSKRNEVKPATAAEVRRTTQAVVENPYGNGVDRVTVVDPIVWMVRQGRLDTRQQSAAARYRSAFDQIYGAQTCILGKEQTSGGLGPGGMSPSEKQLSAAKDLRDAQRVLGWFELVVRSVVGQGCTLDETAVEVSGEASRSTVSGVSTILRRALIVLADEWFPSSTRLSTHGANPRTSTMGEAGVRTVGVAAHCTADRVYTR